MSSGRSLFLPHQARRQKDTTTFALSSFGGFIRAHAFSPLPGFDSGNSLQAAYIPPLLLQCLITGLGDASIFTLTKTWVGFMTGNMVQMVINSFDLLLPSDSNADDNQGEVRRKLESNVSAIVGFMIGCQIASNLVTRLATERTKRITIVLLSLYRSLATLTIILVGTQYPAFRLGGSLSWLVISILAASFGCQSTYSTSLATPFSNTVVFTATLTSVSSDLHLLMLNLTGSNRLKLMGIVGLLGGAALSQVILKVATKASKRDKQQAVQHALIALSIMELLLAASWFLCGILSSWREYQCRGQARLQHVERASESEDI
ncbi:hypothetical protein NDA18_003286 [Ustilago nuda]|nr:hypothetical protein NDA18_003286 [Ustilago nuda]